MGGGGGGGGGGGLGTRLCHTSLFRCFSHAAGSVRSENE